MVEPDAGVVIPVVISGLVVLVLFGAATDAYAKIDCEPLPELTAAPESVKLEDSVVELKLVLLCVIVSTAEADSFCNTGPELITVLESAALAASVVEDERPLDPEGANATATAAHPAPPPAFSAVHEGETGAGVLCTW